MTSMNTGAMLYQLSYMKPQIGSHVIFVGSTFPMKEIDEIIHEINPQKWPGSQCVAS